MSAGDHNEEGFARLDEGFEGVLKQLHAARDAASEWIQRPPSDPVVIEGETSSAESVMQYRVNQWLSELAYLLAREVPNERQLSSILTHVEGMYEECNPIVRDTDGCVYVLQSGPYVKIGRSIDPYGRIDKLKIQLPFPVEVVAVFECVNHKAVEQALHEAYDCYRENGEWFTLSKSNLDALKKTKFAYINEYDGVSLLERDPRLVRRDRVVRSS